MNAARLFVVCALLSLGCACITNPETGKRSFNVVPEATELQLGIDAYSEVKTSTRESSNSRQRAIVQRVADRITAQTGVAYQWEVRLVESNEVNAFCLPGGKIVVYTGILPVLESEAGLAFVMGHEVGHAIARHGGQRMSQTMIVQAGLQVADLSMGDSTQKPMIMGALGAGAQYGVLLPFSRGHESEADYMGMRYMARAGYDPHEAPKVWERMGRGSTQPPEWTSTHPSHENRAADLRDAMAEAMRFYEAAPKKYGLGEDL